MLLALLPAQAQRISTEQKTINVGQVLYKTPVSADFKLKNKSLKTLRIREVKTSCGCTTASYPETVGMGKEFTITAVYDARTLGHFNKQLAIYAGREPLVLTLQGEVVSEIKDFAGNYPFTLGELKTDANDCEFDDVNKGDRPTRRIHIFNNSDKTAQPLFMHLPDYLTAEISPSRIAPRHAGVATLTLDSRKLRDFGLTQTNIYLGFAPGEKVSEATLIPVSTVLLPDFRHTAEQPNSLAPQIKLSADSLTLGSFNGRPRLKGEIELSNIGNAPLEVRNLQMFTSGLEISLSKTTIEPHTQAKLKITAIADQLKTAKRTPRILMITNDPRKPKVVIKINVN